MKKVFSPLEVNDKIVKNVGQKAYFLASLDKLEVATVNRIFLGDKCYHDYIANDYKLDLECIENIITQLHTSSKSGLQGPNKPLIISIRASKLIPAGKLNTVLNVGFNKQTVEELANFYLRPKFAYESYYFFVTNFLKFCYGISTAQVKNIEERFVFSKKYQDFTELKLNEIKELIDIFLGFAEKNNFHIPDSIYEQAGLIIEKYYTTWNSRDYKEEKIKNSLSIKKGLALVFEEMTFGNLGENSGCFKAYSRNPNSGVRGIHGEFFRFQQFQPYNDRVLRCENLEALEKPMLERLREYTEALEKYLKMDLCLEGVVEDGVMRITNLYEIPKTIRAEVQICNDFIAEKKLDFQKAAKLINSAKLHLFYSNICQSSVTDLSFAKGDLISQGACTGVLVFDNLDIQKAIKNHEDFIIVITKDYEIDQEVLKFASGIIQRGRRFTSKLADLARELNIPCLGIDLKYRIQNKQILFENNKILKAQELITLDANSGRVYKTKKTIVRESDDGAIVELVKSIKEHLNMDVYYYDRLQNFNSNSIADCMIWDPVQIVRSSISSINALKLLFGLLKQKELISFKNSLSANFEKQLKQVNSEEVSISLPEDIIQTLIPSSKEIIDFIEISKLDFDEVQRTILQLTSKSNNGIQGCKILLENSTIFALIIQALLEALWKVKQKKEFIPTLYLSHINSSSEFIYFNNLIQEAKEKLCPELDLQIGITITNSSGVVNYKELSKIVSNIIIDLDNISSNFYGLSSNNSFVVNKLTTADVWPKNYLKDFNPHDFGKFIQTYIAKQDGIKLGLKNDRSYKKDFKSWFEKQDYDFIVINQNWLLNSMLNLVNKKID